jgi:NAD(P)H-quinone oxidoreductase subunit 4
MLSALIWVPFVAALVIALLPEQAAEARSRWIAAIAAAIAFALALLVLVQFDPSLSGFQFTEQLPWLQDLGLSYRLGVDGLSLPLVMLTTLLMGLVIYATDSQIERPRLYYAMLMLIGGGVTGVFLAQDLLLFFLFYEIELIPLYLLIAIWGGERRAYASTKFLIYTALSGVLLLASFLGLVGLSGADSFAVDPALAQGLGLGQQLLLLLLMIVAFGIKIPMVPLHTWLPDAHVEASTPVSMLLAGILLKLGTYGLLRFGLGLLPDAWDVLAPGLAVVAVISTLYGSLNAIVQQDMKKLVAYSSIGHMGYIILGMAAASEVSIAGTVAQMVSHGLISALLFLLVGLIYSHTGTRDLQVLRGLLNPERGLPLVGSLMIFAVMASSGLPGLVGFVAEFCIFQGSFIAFPIQTLLCIIGTGLTSVYFLLLVNRAFFGRLAEQLGQINRVTFGELAPAALLSLLILLLGVQPRWLLGWTEASAHGLAELQLRTVVRAQAPTGLSLPGVGGLAIAPAPQRF